MRPDPSAHSTIRQSLTAGVQDAFTFGLIVAILGLILSIFIKSAQSHKPSKQTIKRTSFEKAENHQN